MKLKKLSNKMVLSLAFLVLSLLGLGGCATLAVDAVETGSSEGDAGEISVIEVGIEPTPTPTRLTYSNEEYGFEFTYPETWTLTEDGHGVVLKKGPNRLVIYFCWENECIHPYFGRTSIPAGNLIYADKLSFLGQVIPAELLQYEGKSKAVYYSEPGLQIVIDNLVFMIVLEDQESDYQEVDLSQATINEAKAIIESAEWLETRSTTGANSHAIALEASLKVKHAVQPGGVHPIKVNFSLNNQTEEPLYILKWYTPFEGIAGDIFEVYRDGLAIPYQGILASRGDPTPESYLFLGAGEALSTDINLEEAYDFSQPGLYKIKYRSPSISHIAWSQAEMATTLDELGPVKIPSYEVQVFVSGASENEMPAVHTADDARTMFAAYLQAQKGEIFDEQSLQVEEIPFPEARAVGPVQIFTVTEGPFQNESFLINGDRVLQLGAALGGQGLTSLAISDLDNDTQPELLFTYSGGLSPQLGSDLQSRVGVYAPAYDPTRTLEADIVYLGEMTLLAENAAKVALQVAIPFEESNGPSYQFTLGYLSLDLQDERLSLIAEVVPQLPEDIENSLLTKE